VAALLYIPSLLFAKLAVLVLVKTITPNRWHERTAYLIAAFIVLWAMTGEFAAALICHIPRTWDCVQGQCNGRVNVTKLLNICLLTSKLACFLDLFRGHEPTHRGCAHYITAHHNLQSSSIFGQEGVCLLILCRSYYVSHGFLASDPVLI